MRVVGALFVFGFGLVLFFARKDLKAGLTGELGKRFIGWMIIAPLFLVATCVGGLAAAAILWFLFYRVTVEYVRVGGVGRPYAIYLYTLIPATFLVAQFFPTLYFALPAASILLLSLVPILSRHVEDLYLQLSFAGRGYLYLVWSIGHLILLKQAGGVGLVMLVGVGVALSDVMQYTVGKLIGKHIISPEVNPRKAWEGLLGDLIGAGVAVALFNFALPPEFVLPHKIALAFIIGLGAAWGDLISSLVKRAAGSKDWGDFLPGHGGLLDRANSMVVVIPLVYYFTHLVLEYGKP
ncbi:MAG: phosphatidate cytidylyltransferase [Elusimicrobiota bacterium]